MGRKQTYFNVQVSLSRITVVLPTLNSAKVQKFHNRGQLSLENFYVCKTSYVTRQFGIVPRCWPKVTVFQTIISFLLNYIYTVMCGHPPRQPFIVQTSSLNPHPVNRRKQQWCTMSWRMMQRKWHPLLQIMMNLFSTDRVFYCRMTAVMCWLI